MSTATITNVQVGFALNEIATQAAAIRRLATVLMNAPEDERDYPALLSGIQSLAGGIGLTSDMVSLRLDEGAAFGGVEEWLMPPAYRNAEQASEVPA